MATVATRRKCVGQKVDKWWPDGEGGPIYHAPGECYWQCKNCLTLDLAFLSLDRCLPPVYSRARASSVPRDPHSSFLDFRYEEFRDNRSCCRCPETLRKIRRWRRCPLAPAAAPEKRIKLSSRETSWDSSTWNLLLSLPLHNWLLSLPIAVRSNARLLPTTHGVSLEDFREILFYFCKLVRYWNNL